ncbi:proteasome subunit alpha type-7-like [Humulus lupulus]|uniref:proteasome subunit alpha type-7-like n=1 Tax=Humulus lupulus TaxID=3486 RepID=UPI002B4149CA|nr:proteasome subunit alpha type-7-like [Humulus lupulus]
MVEHKKALLQLPYGRRSLSYLLHEDKLQAWDLLEQDQPTDNVTYRKYTEWEHELKNLQLKLPDELKATKSKLEAKDSEIKDRESRIKGLEELNAKLEEEKKATFDIIEGEKVCPLEEFKQKKDHRRCVGFENATGLKKKSTAKLQDSRTVRKIVNLDDHIALACPGLKANARVLINKVRIECQSHQLTVEDLVTVEYITCYIAGLQQKYTQSGCVRSFGLSTLIIGFDPYTGAPTLYQTDPSGTFSTWKANGTGRNSNSLREFPEKNYKETTRQQTVKLALSALLEVSNSKRCIFNLVS